MWFCDQPRSNINYEMTTKQPVPNDTERTVHNALYTRQHLPVTAPDTTNASTSHVYDYASVGVNSKKNPELSDLDIPQHTLLLHSSTASTSDAGGGGAGSHTYSKPTTPITNYDVANTFPIPSPGGSSSAGYAAVQVSDYSKLNGGGGGDPSFANSQTSEMDSREYSQIDEAHKYAKLSETNSKGYSQLNVSDLHAPQGVTAADAAAQPYECPLSANSSEREAGAESHTYVTLENPESHAADVAAQPYECPLLANSSKREAGAESHTYVTLENPESHAYATLAIEEGHAGYSKLHVQLEGSSQATKHE